MVSPFIMAGANTRVVRRSEALTERQESYVIICLLGICW